MQNLFRPIAHSLIWVALVAGSGLALAQAPAQAPASAAATSPLGDLTEYRAIAEDSLKIVKTGDFAGANKRLKDLETSWDNAEDRMKKKSYNRWRAVDNAMDAALDKLSAKKPDAAASEKALENLIARLR